MYKEFETVLKMEAAGGDAILPSRIAPVDR
jgi:hypothetical protein